MADRLSNALHLPGDMIRWWIDELSELLPKRLMSATADLRPCLILAMTGKDTILLESTTKHGERERGRIIETGDSASAGSSAAQPSTALAGMTKRRYRKWPLVVRLASDLGLRKCVDLPLAAKDDLAQLLHFELDRLTPFEAENVRFAWRIVKTEAKAGRMQVELEMAPKTVVDKGLELVAIQGRKVDRVELEGGPDNHEPLDLLPRPIEAKPGKSLLGRILPLTAFVLLIIAIAIPLRKQQAQMVSLEKEIALVRAEAEENLALREQLDSLTREARFLVDAKNGRAMMTEVLAELTRLIPDHSHIVQLQIGKETIELSGLAETASDLIVILDQSPLLMSPRFRSPVTRDPRSGKERFQISADLAEGTS